MSNEWESAYKSGTHINAWPWTDLVTLLNRNLGLSHKPLRVLEIGVGTGNNISYLQSLGGIFDGFDSSPTAIKIAQERHPNLKDRLKLSTFMEYEMGEDRYDVIVDRASLTHASEYEINIVLKKVFRGLNHNGIYLGIDWFSTNHPEFKLDSTISEGFSRSGIQKGYFSPLGTVTFSNYESMSKRFSQFEIIYLAEKQLMDHLDNAPKVIFASWNIVARKGY